MIVAPIGQNFRLQDLGDASAAAQRFLSTTVAPEGSDKEARLIRASERCAAASWQVAGTSWLPSSVSDSAKKNLLQGVARKWQVCTMNSVKCRSYGAPHLVSSCTCYRQDENGEVYYTCEFTVQSPKFFRHNLSVYAVR